LLEEQFRSGGQGGLRQVKIELCALTSLCYLLPRALAG